MGFLKKDAAWYEEAWELSGSVTYPSTRISYFCAYIVHLRLYPTRLYVAYGPTWKPPPGHFVPRL
eukprot:2108516-Rhodomonas_salina.1